MMVVRLCLPSGPGGFFLGKVVGTLMAIFIDNAKMAFKAATELISDPDNRDRQIVRAWDQSRINHRFENKKSFKKAVRKNQKILKFPKTIDSLFKASNYFFSTKVKNRGTKPKNREETLYFKNGDTKQTGRLRQQHPKGPLAKIDKRAKTHRFLSQRRFRFLKEWHERHRACLPCFRVPEGGLHAGKRHLEFAYDGREVSGWHLSEGTVEISRRDIECRIGSALKEILGIRHK
jgi:hypothetical protein